MRRPTLLFLFALICAFGIAACTGEADRSLVAATPLEAVEPAAGGTFVASGNSGCYAVKFNATGPVDAGGFPTGPPTVSGDLEGTYDLFPDVPGSLKFAGATIKVSGEVHWTITGGVLPEGVEEFKTSIDNQNIAVDRPGSPPNVFENKGKHRALEGVGKANLTYQGVTETPGYFDWDYQGVICP